MTRPIEFRAWDKVNKKMVDVIDFSCMNYPDKYEVMQFTGLLDKHGNKIWEGDVVEFRNFDISIAPLRLPVVWDKELCGFWCDDGNNIRNMEQITRYDTTSGLVIGDIYSTPELLNK